MTRCYYEAHNGTDESTVTSVQQSKYDVSIYCNKILGYNLDVSYGTALQFHGNIFSDYRSTYGQIDRHKHTTRLVRFPTQTDSSTRLDHRCEAYSENKYRFPVKKSSKVSYKMLLLSDSTFFKLCFHIFVAIIEALIVAENKVLYTLLIECGRLRPK